MPGLRDAAEWVVKRISALTRTATDADLTDSEYMAVDNASAYTRKITVASLATWILGKIKSLATTITAFRTGDVIPVDGPSGTAKMSKDNLLRVTAENAVNSGVAGSGDVTKIIGEDVIDNYYSDEVTIAEDGKYVASDSSVLPNVDFAISDSITLDDGETLQIIAGGYMTYVAMISSYDSGTDTYTRLVQSSGSDRKLYSYTNTTGSSMTIRLSYSKERKPFIYIKGVIDNSELLPELSMFESLGVIGDSYASGIIYTPDGSNFDTFYNKSWPQVLGRKNGINATNYSFGGARTNTWLTNASYGLPKMLSDPALDAYAIVLSINDRIRGGAGWLGTIADIHVGDPSLNANSFYGCYARIIENILSHAPNAKIFCVQHAYNATGLPKDYNDAIADIASLYGIPCISQFEDEFFTTDVYTQMYGGHPTYIGYAGMADAMCRLIRKSMVKYLSYFKEYLPIT